MIIPRLLASLVPLLGLRETDAFFRTVQNATDLFHKIKGENGQNNCQLCASLLRWQAPADRIVLQYKEAFATLRNGRLLPGRESTGWTTGKVHNPAGAVLFRREVFRYVFSSQPVKNSPPQAKNSHGADRAAKRAKMFLSFCPMPH